MGGGISGEHVDRIRPLSAQVELHSPSDSPFIGIFVPADRLGSLPLDYDNACTLELVVDTCK